MAGAGTGRMRNNFTLVGRSGGAGARNANPAGEHESAHFGGSFGCGPYATSRCRGVVPNIRRQTGMGAYASFRP
jgi:hypothetical protein